MNRKPKALGEGANDNVLKKTLKKFKKYTIKYIFNPDDLGQKLSIP